MDRVRFYFLGTVFLAVGSASFITPAPAQKAVCVVPVADLIGNAAQKSNPTRPHQSYLSLPLAQKVFEEPARVHQLLFNEVVTIKDIRGQEALIEIPNLFYETAQSAQHQAQYWTLLRNLRTFDQLEKQNINVAAFPPPLTQNKERFEKALRNTVALTQPFVDPMSHTTYSAGTRFVVASSTQHQVAVQIFDPTRSRIKQVVIPKTLCLLHEEKDQKERVRDFVRIVTTWAHQPSGFIPYVWGGCSVGQLCQQDQFCEEQGVFCRNELTKNEPRAGLDCTGLVARAAHLAGIPYFYKNSLTLAKYVAPLQREEAITDGDLIWIPGHVMVISSVAKARLVEARHYSHGYGKVHEIPLASQFQGMGSYETLAETFFARGPLKRLNKAGAVVQVIPEFKILKLASVWR